MTTSRSAYVCARIALFLVCMLAAALRPIGAADNKTAIASDLPAAGIHAPVVTFVAQDGKRLRPVLGAPGASLLGDEVPLPDGITNLAISPLGTFALAERTGVQTLSVLPVGMDGVGTLQPIAGSFEHSDAVEFSASGSTAVVYSAARTRVQIITNLPSAPVVREVDVSSLSAAVISMAVSDDGSLLLVGVSDGQNGGVYRVTPDNTIVSILAAGAPSALRLIPQADAALVADSALNQILLLSPLSSAPVAQTLAAANDGVNGPNSIELLAGNSTAVVANTNASTLLLIDLQKPIVSTVPILAPAMNLKPIKNHTSVALYTAMPAAFWVLMGGGSDTPVVTLIADPGPSANRQ